MAHTDGLNPLSRMLYYVTSDLPPTEKLVLYTKHFLRANPSSVCTLWLFMPLQTPFICSGRGQPGQYQQKKGLYSAFERHKTLFFFSGERAGFLLYTWLDVNLL
jgi:hypothetical protein